MASSSGVWQQQLATTLTDLQVIDDVISICLQYARQQRLYCVHVKARANANDGYAVDVYDPSADAWEQIKTSDHLPATRISPRRFGCFTMDGQLAVWVDNHQVLQLQQWHSGNWTRRLIESRPFITECFEVPGRGFWLSEENDFNGISLVDRDHREIKLLKQHGHAGWSLMGVMPDGLHAIVQCRSSDGLGLLNIDTGASHPFAASDSSPCMVPGFNAAIALDRRRILVTGGWPRGTNRKMASTRCAVYDLVTRSWSAAEHMLVERMWHRLVMVEELVYAVGGHEGYAGRSTVSHPEVEWYDPDEDMWFLLPGNPLPTAVRYVDAVACV